MKKFIPIITTAVFLIVACIPAFDPSSVADATPEQIAHVEPPCWWSGMRNSLQIMVNGPEIGTYSVEAKGLGGVSVKETHKAESPNYLFIDLNINKGVEGTAYLVFTSPDGSQMKVPYSISPKQEASRESFSTKDMIYL
ncbi:MAG TPA: cyclomaltodextrinase N-terminal domain-containing protein, partial [Candidatus Cryptobacteroides sp.]|nr:cyclomaltodextrinase N-terminal domain-containing protein [Candidatus Cryptobacteroides sp.]